MFKYLPLGDSAILIKVGTVISIDAHKQIRALIIGITNSKIDGIRELIPAYNELMVNYNPSEVRFNSLIDNLKHIERNLNQDNLSKTELIHIPVCYDNEFAPDLEIVAKTNSLTQKEVINIHSSSEYLVYMLGFTPGFCYLGGLSDQLFTPRKESPRQIIKAGSVGIAGNQTGVYPIDSPGGWQLIGKTPIRLFDPERNPEFLVEAGNYIKFNPVTKTEFEEIHTMVSAGEYILRKEGRDG